MEIRENKKYVNKANFVVEVTRIDDDHITIFAEKTNLKTVINKSVFLILFSEFRPAKLN